MFKYMYNYFCYFLQVFFADATASKLYVSTDEGNSFITRNLSSNINPRSLLLHPTVGKWFLAHDPTNNGVSLVTFRL